MDKVSESISIFLEKEKNVISEYLYEQLNKKFSLNNYNYSKVNKLFVLNFAQTIGLKIPETFCTNNQSSLQEKLSTNDLITKPLSNPVNYYGDTYWLPNYTTTVNSEKLKPSCSIISLSQTECKFDCVEKKSTIILFPPKSSFLPTCIG